MMDFTERMIEKVALALHGTTDVKIGDHNISFGRVLSVVSPCVTPFSTRRVST